MKKIILMIILFNLVNILLGQEYPYQIEKLSLEEGISHNVVYCINQDSEKFLWFGTMFGLVRYDGLEYLNFRTDPLDDNTLSDDDIVTIYEDSGRKLWIGTFGGGLNSLDTKTFKIERFTPEKLNLTEWSGIVWDIVEDSSQNIWFATNNQGIIKLNKNDFSFNQYKNDDTINVLPSNVIRDMVFADNKIWLSGYGGLGSYDISTDKFDIYTDEKVKDLYISSIVSLKGIGFLCGTNKGIFVFNSQNKNFSQIAVPIENTSEPINVNKIILTKNGQFWVGTMQGIIVLDKSFNPLQQITQNDGLYNNNIVSLLEDHSGNIWVGSYLGGISKILLRPNRFSLIAYDQNSEESLSERKIMDFATDSKEQIYALTSKGISKLNNELQVIKTFSEINNLRQDKSNIRFSAVDISKSNQIFIGTNKGVAFVDDNFKLIRKYNSQENQISSDIITKLFFDSKDNLWIGTTNGLSRLDLKTDEIVNWESRSEINKLMGQNVLSIFEDSYGIIWVGTFRGLNKINPSNGEVEFYGPSLKDNSTISNKYLFDFYEDDSNKVWIASGNGINIYDRKTKSFEHLSEKEGLPNGVIQSIIEDNGSIYFGTNQGVAIYDRAKGIFKNYNISDGLGNNLFSPSAALKINNDRILFGGLNGISVIHTNKFYENTILPENRIIAMKLFDKKIDQDFFQNIELDHSENSISFKFASLEFTNPKYNRFAYKLDGIEKDWIYTNSNNVSYHLLPSGAYTFYVKSSNNDGIWNNKPASISFEILPPFWKTIWFYLLVGALVFGVVIWTHYQRLQSKLRMFLKIEEAKREENESVRKRAAEDFHDELGHIITRISLLSEVLKRKFQNEEDENLTQINKLGLLSKELSTKMRDFIWSLDSKNDTLYDLVIRLKDFGDDLFYGTPVSFTINGVNNDLKDIKLNLDWRRHLTLIFKEAMNNIVKYSKCNNADLVIEKKGSNIKIELKDDGRGFDLETIKKGNGLRNMKSRAGYIKSKLAIVSKLNSGTKISFEGMIS